MIAGESKVMFFEKREAEVGILVHLIGYLCQQ